MSSSVASWPAYRFLRRQVKWSGIPITLYFHVVTSFLVNIENSKSNCWSSDSNERSLLQLPYLVFNNRDMATKAEGAQRNMHKAQMIAVTLSAQSRPTGRLLFLGQSGPGRPLGPWVPKQGRCTLWGQKGYWREDCDQRALCTEAGIGGWMPQGPASEVGRSSALVPFTVVGQKTYQPEAKRGSAWRYYLHNQSQVVTDVAGYLTEFLVDNFLDLNPKDWKI